MASEAVQAGASSPSALVDFIAGTAAGIASLLAGHPFDTVKTRLQAQPAATPPTSSSAVESLRPSLAGSSQFVGSYRAIPTSGVLSYAHVQSSAVASEAVSVPIYRSATDAFRMIIKEERAAGLYKGVTSPMLGVAVMNASIFGLYSMSLRYQQQHGYLEGYPITQVFVAGMLSGLGSSLITSPIDLVKIREQMNTHTRPSTWQVFRDVLRSEGLFRGVYRGWCTTAVRDLGYGPYFASYEMLNSQIRAYTDRPLSNVDMAVSGAVAGVVAWVSTFWADVIKTKIQATSASDYRAGSLFWTTARHTYAQGGWRAFFVGVGPTILRALPVNAVLFVTYETTKQMLISHGF
ncbi:hypothetical protein PaG_06436 [Moesziomyces aphidis]|jgi:solute carrier family 25 carnitine/acylcarnitine transporter 20/29|uniref:Uncharacterized protein n=1 Tax=Moesziomyces aphidis TaxID=84754 RepID=W3VFB3_MOEAP|nr:hypothetical protein PaG_06436 [Moesziomyces aphidis]